MTDTTPQDVWPDSADPVDEALAQLREPHHLLAEALLLTRAAQATGQEIDTTPAERDENGDLGDEEFRREARHRRRLDEAASLTQIAKVAAELAAGQVVFPSTSNDLDVMAEQPSPNAQPQAVNGVRFTCTIYGWFIGRVGGREWMWVEGLGYLDVTHAEAVSVPAANGQCDARFSGTVKSAAGEHALCVTDGGTSVTLLRALIVESADE